MARDAVWTDGRSVWKRVTTRGAGEGGGLRRIIYQQVINTGSLITTILSRSLQLKLWLFSYPFYPIDWHYSCWSKDSGIYSFMVIVYSKKQNIGENECISLIIN